MTEWWLRFNPVVKTGEAAYIFLEKQLLPLRKRATRANHSFVANKDKLMWIKYRWAGVFLPAVLFLLIWTEIGMGQQAAAVPVSRGLSARVAAADSIIRGFMQSSYVPG